MALRNTLDPALEALSKTDYFSFLTRVKSLSNKVFAPYLIYRGKEILDVFIQDVEGLERLITEGRTPANTLAATFGEIFKINYKEVFNHLQAKEWRLEAKLDFNFDVGALTTLQQIVVDRKPAVFNNENSRKYYGDLLTLLGASIGRIAGYQASPIANLTTEVARQQRDFAAYKLRFDAAKQRIQALQAKEAADKAAREEQPGSPEHSSSGSDNDSPQHSPHGSRSAEHKQDSPQSTRSNSSNSSQGTPEHLVLPQAAKKASSAAEATRPTRQPLSFDEDEGLPSIAQTQFIAQNGLADKDRMKRQVLAAAAAKKEAQNGQKGGQKKSWWS